jgi:SAM-dependent methyltransferase
VTLSGGLERAIGLLDPARRPKSAAVPDGYLDLLGGAGRRGGGPAQRLMLTRGLPVVYERWWRPAWGRVLMGPLGPGTQGERQIAHELLELGPGDTVLDIACGPGNFVREFAGSIGKRGLVVGLDASQTMLARAVEDTRAAASNVAYVRGDAIRLPFRDGCFDAVCCFAALHLFDAPLAALDAMERVLAPGGRVAILTSARAPLTPAPVGALVGAATRLRVFGRDEITGALEERGFEGVQRRISGLAQFVGARKRTSTAAG